MGVAFLTIAGLMIGNGASISSVVFVRLGGDSVPCFLKLTDRFVEFEPRTVLRRLEFSSNTGVVVVD